MSGNIVPSFEPREMHSFLTQVQAKANSFLIKTHPVTNHEIIVDVIVHAPHNESFPLQWTHRRTGTRVQQELQTSYLVRCP